MTERPRVTPRGYALAAAMALIAPGAACEDLLQEPDSGSMLAPATLEAASGDQQTGATGQPLAAPLRVRVVDGEGRPLSRIRIEWSTGPGAGRVEPRSSFTNADGVAEATWILGSAPGEQQLRAGLGAALPVVFHATAVP